MKEAEALDAAGYEVRVFACQQSDRWTALDRDVLANARWSAQLVAWNRSTKAARFWYTRARHQVAQSLARALPWDGSPGVREAIAHRAYDRAHSELMRAAIGWQADLYVAHNLQALPIAARAAEVHGARLGFDAEDMHSAMRPASRRAGVVDEIIATIERTYFPRCDYLTVASPGFADAYAKRLGVSIDAVILNVDRLTDRKGAVAPVRRRRTPDEPLRLYWFSQTIGASRGIEDVLEAMALLNEFPVELHLRGEWQPGYRDRLFDMARTLRINPGAITQADPGPPADMVRLASEHDVGLATEQRDHESRDLQLSNKIFTYLMGGNAIVATATQGQRWLLSTIDSAIEYEPRDTARLAAGLRRWITEPFALSDARLAAWHAASERYNWEREQKVLLSVVAAALDAPTPRCRSTERV